MCIKTCTTGGVIKLVVGDIESDGGNSFKSNINLVGNSMVDSIGNSILDLAGNSILDLTGYPFSSSLVIFKACLQILSCKAQEKSHIKRNSPLLITWNLHDMFDWICTIDTKKHTFHLWNIKTIMIFIIGDSYQMQDRGTIINQLKTEI